VSNQQALENGIQVADARPGAGLGGRRSAPTLSDVSKRRTELWTMSVILMATVTVGIALLSLGQDLLPEPFGFDQGMSRILGVLVGGLALALITYVIEKERSLRQLADSLIKERVRSETLSNRLTEMRKLSQVWRALNATLDQQKVLELIVSSALDLLDADEGSILLLNGDKSQLELASYRGPVPRQELRSWTSLSRSFAGEVARTRKGLRVNEIEPDRLSQDCDGHHRRISSYIGVPLKRAESLLGVLEIGEVGGRAPFTSEELTALDFFAEHAAIAIGNARTFEQERNTIARLEELDRLKDDFVAVVSHELRSPLTAIIGAAKTVARKGSEMSPEQTVSFMDMIDRQADKMLRLAEDFLTAARMESGMPLMRREAIDVRELCERVIRDLKHSRHGKDRTVLLRLDPERPEVWGDRAAMEQVVSNLVENGLKYAPAPSAVSVTVTEGASEAVLEVRDEGPGISPDNLGSIFDRYRQVDPAARSSGGVGLGLFIVKNLVDAHRGRIEVDSEVGVGTSFRVHMPKRATY
jgi:signal transduction histidine kinase